jgi:hypothetical protein
MDEMAKQMAGTIERPARTRWNAAGKILVMPIDDGCYPASVAPVRCREQPARTFQAAITPRMLYLSRLSKLQQSIADH